MRIPLSRTAIAVTLVLGSAGAFAQAPSPEKGCHFAKDHYGHEHQYCEPKVPGVTGTSVQAPGLEKGCHFAKDHYGHEHQDCRPMNEPRCHAAKNHYGQTVQSCSKAK